MLLLLSVVAVAVLSLLLLLVCALPLLFWLPSGSFSSSCSILSRQRLVWFAGYPNSCSNGTATQAVGCETNPLQHLPIEAHSPGDDWWVNIWRMRTPVASSLREIHTDVGISGTLAVWRPPGSLDAQHANVCPQFDSVLLFRVLMRPFKKFTLPSARWLLCFSLLLSMLSSTAESPGPVRDGWLVVALQSDCLTAQTVESIRHTLRNRWCSVVLSWHCHRQGEPVLRLRSFEAQVASLVFHSPVVHFRSP